MTSQRSFNLVLVDDASDMGRLIEKYLTADLDGLVRVTTMTNSADARKWIDEHNCDILISDIEMPGSDGLSMLRFAKSRNAWTRVIFMTAYSTWDRIAESIENGASDYLLKPIHRDDVVQLVKQECERLSRWQRAIRSALTTA